MQKIRELRRRAGITQEALALRVGVSRQAVASWDTGESWPNSELLPKISYALGCTIPELFEPTELAEASDPDTRQD